MMTESNICVLIISTSNKTDNCPNLPCSTIILATRQKNTNNMHVLTPNRQFPCLYHDCFLLLPDKMLLGFILFTGGRGHQTHKSWPSALPEGDAAERKELAGIFTLRGLVYCMF